MTISCSQCGVVKGEVNHWFFAWMERGNKRLCVVPWEEDEGLIHEPMVQKLCGQNCVHKFTQQFLDSLRVFTS
jgi:hypothetical protein